MRVKYIVDERGKRKAAILSIKDLVIQERKSLKKGLKGEADSFDKYIIRMMKNIRKNGVLNSK